MAGARVAARVSAPPAGRRRLRCPRVLISPASHRDPVESMAGEKAELFGPVVCASTPLLLIPQTNSPDTPIIRGLVPVLAPEQLCCCTGPWSGRSCAHLFVLAWERKRENL